jgi:hypothetical protein
MSTVTTLNERIYQAVHYGSVYEALEVQVFTHAELLRWIPTALFGERTQIAYKAVTDQIHPNDQYLDDGVHFLISAPQFLAMAVSLGMKPNTMAKLGAKVCDDNSVLAALRTHLVNGYGTQSVVELTRLIVTGAGREPYVQSRLSTCYRCRNFVYSRLSPSEINYALLESDWTKKLRYNVALAPLILARVAGLQKVAPIYYAEVGYKLYHAVAIKLHKDKLLMNLSQDELKTFNTFFPGIIDARILTYCEGAYRIALLGNDIAGYVLGFPIHEFIPDDEQIAVALDQFTVLGREAYAQHIAKYALQLHVVPTPFSFADPTFKNDEDVLTEAIVNYSPFDVVSFRSGSHIFRFTRCEFAQMVEKKKNIWTNEWLPPSVLSTVKARHSMAKALGLPPCRTVVEMLERAEKGTLFSTDEPETLSQPMFNNLFDEVRLPLHAWSPRAPPPGQRDDDEMPQLRDLDDEDRVRVNSPVRLVDDSDVAGPTPIFRGEDRVHSPILSPRDVINGMFHVNRQPTLTLASEDSDDSDEAESSDADSSESVAEQPPLADLLSMMRNDARPQAGGARVFGSPMWAPAPGEQALGRAIRRVAAEQMVGRMRGGDDVVDMVQPSPPTMTFVEFARSLGNVIDVPLLDFEHLYP